MLRHRVAWVVPPSWRRHAVSLGVRRSTNGDVYERGYKDDNEHGKGGYT